MANHLFVRAAQTSSADPQEHATARFVKSVKGVFSYSTPYTGTMLLERQLVSFAKVFQQPGPVLEYLRLLNTDAARMHSDFMKLRRKHGWRAEGIGECQETELVGPR